MLISDSMVFMKLLKLMQSLMHVTLLVVSVTSCLE